MAYLFSFKSNLFCYMWFWYEINLIMETRIYNNIYTIKSRFYNRTNLHLLSRFLFWTVNNHKTIHELYVIKLLDSDEKRWIYIYTHTHIARLIVLRCQSFEYLHCSRFRSKNIIQAIMIQFVPIANQKQANRW